MSAWDELADAVLTHDVEREQHAWQELTCLGCRRETAIPGEHECADCLIGSAHRRDDTERAAVLLPRHGFGHRVPRAVLDAANGAA